MPAIFKSRSMFAFIFPVFLGILLVMMFDQAFNQYQQKIIQHSEAATLTQIQSIISRVQSEVLMSQQIEKSFSEFSDAFAARNLDNKTEKQKISELFNELLPPDIASNSQVWFFTRTGSSFSAVDFQPFSVAKKGAMTRVLTALNEISNGSGNETSERSNARFISGVFGENSMPEYLARHRRGKVTPVIFEDHQHYLYWQKLEDKGQCIAGYLALFKGEFIENHERPLQRLANRIFRDSAGRIVAAFVRPEQLDPKFRPILPQKLPMVDSNHALIIKSMKKLWKSGNFAPRKMHRFGDYWLYFNSIANESAYNAIICLPVAVEKSTWNFWIKRMLFMFFLFWCAFYWLRLRTGGMSLGIAFRLLFFMTAMLPVGLLAILGLNLIDQTINIKVRSRVNEGFKKLERMNEKSENLVSLSALAIKDVLNNNNFQELIISDSADSKNQGFKLIQNLLAAKKLIISYLFLLKPGQLSEFFVSSPADRELARYHLDYSAVSCNNFHEHLGFSDQESPPLILSPVQKTMAATSNNSFTRDTFLAALEKPSIFEGNDASKLLIFSAVIERQGKVKAYLVTGLTMSAVVEVLQEELSFTHNTDYAHYICISREKNLAKKILPDMNSAFLRSSSGKKLISFLESAAISNYQMQLHDNDHVLIYEPLKKVRLYSAGGLISIKDINNERETKHYLLAILLAILSGLIYLLSATVSRLVIEPTRRLAEVFHAIAEENYEHGFNYPYNNELGILANATSAMITGLRQRKLLGKFVSRTFDSKVIDSTSRETAQELDGVILFSDIRSFTTISEQYPSELIGQMLNGHLKNMVEVIHRHGGQVEQFIGDAVVAFFQGEGKSACENAVFAAAAMMQKHHETILKRAQHNQIVYDIGIGLEYGRVMAGTLKSGSRSEFSVIGPARARAEQFEGATKQGNFTRIIAGNQLFEQLPHLSAEFARHNEDCHELKRLELHQ